ncbi:MAG: DUF2608 domain-containing protein [Francisellaceae bacterium]|nr:DUF2608 domain-containing protein [Francisellaceae bacterium]
MENDKTNYNRPKLTLGFIVILLCTFIAMPINAASFDIIEGKELSVVFHAQKSIKTKNTPLIVLDIDNTILRSTKSLGTTWWFYAMKETAKNNGVSFDHRERVLTSIEIEVQKKVERELVEPEIANLIIDPQQKGLVIALTSRPFSLYSPTVGQLSKQGVDLNTRYFQSIEKNWDGLGVFKDGIISVGGVNNKEVELATFLKLVANEYEIDAIIFADDTYKYISSVGEFCENNNLSYLGLHYTHEEENEKKFSINIAVNELDDLLGESWGQHFESAKEYALYDPRITL